MSRAKGCGAKGGSSYRSGGERGGGRLPTNSSFTKDAKTINAQVCRYAQDGDMQGLLDYVASQRDHMNYVNLSTAMHKLAHLVKDGNMVVHLNDWRFTMLHERARMALVLQYRESGMPGAEVMPRCWSTLAWSYATLNVPGLDIQHIFAMIAELSVPNFQAFKLVEFTNLVWAFAKAQVSNVYLFQAARSHIAVNLASFSRSHLSTLVWALVTAQQDQASILCKLTEKFIQRVGTERVDPVGISNLMWGLATANVHPKMHVLQHIGNDALDLLPAFKPQELSITAWAFSRLGVRHDRLFAAVARRLYQDLNFQQRMHAQGLANLMWAFNRQLKLDSAVGPQLAAAMQKMLPRCVMLIDQFKTQEFSCICQSLQDAGVQWGTCPEATAFWNMAAPRTGHVQAQRGFEEDAPQPPQGSQKVQLRVNEGSFETASTRTEDSGPYACSDVESEDGDKLGMLKSDVYSSGRVGSTKTPCAVDYGETSLHHKYVPMQIGVSTMATSADDAKQMLQVQFPATQVCPKQPFQFEALHALDTSAADGDEIAMPDQYENAGDTFPLFQPQCQQKASNENLQTGLSFENQVCYIVKNTFVEEAEVDNRKVPEALYTSEPLPARADFSAGRLLKFPTLRQRPVYNK